MKGKFIVIYGANNLGKSLQLKLLEESLQKQNIPTKRIKYPIYDLKPSGPKLNAVLREGLKMPEINVQTLFVQNRSDYQPQLEKDLRKGIWVLAEDYIGTGIAWGLVRGLSLEKLEELNKGLIKEDLSILLYGQRFASGKETTHRNEKDDKIWKLAQQKHLLLAEKYRWQKVCATRTVEEVHKDIWNIIVKSFSSYHLSSSN